MARSAVRQSGRRTIVVAVLPGIVASETADKPFSYRE